jgi:hypothetical protein
MIWFTRDITKCSFVPCVPKYHAVLGLILGSGNASMYEGRLERRGVLIDPTKKRRDGGLP